MLRFYERLEIGVKEMVVASCCWAEPAPKNEQGNLAYYLLFLTSIAAGAGQQLLQVVTALAV